MPRNRDFKNDPARKIEIIISTIDDNNNIGCLPAVQKSEDCGPPYG